MIELGTLYSRDVNGNLLTWSVAAEGDVVVTRHGRLGCKQVETRTRATATNVGRANARTAEEQALFEAVAARDKKLKLGYFDTADAASTSVVMLPMLAEPLRREVRRNGRVVTVTNDVTFPVDAQPKLNGLRGLAVCRPDGTIDIISRQAELWNLPHIQVALASIMRPGCMLDGEIYLHGTPLQMINSLVKDYRAESLALEYHIYDAPAMGSLSDLDASWEERLSWLRRLFQQEGVPACLHPVHTRRLMTMDEVVRFCSDCVVGGYEGVILRQLDRPYVLHKRRTHLIKVKEFSDAEFLIEDGIGRELVHRGFTILDKFVCRNDLNLKTFEVVPRGSDDDKRRWFEELPQLIGRRLVVRFPERSVDGVPQGNPVGLCIRLDEDMPSDDEDDMWS